MALGQIANFVRSKGDPKVISTGPSSLGSSDRMARNLGWFSLGLGAFELLAPERVTRALGMEGREGLVRLYGAREIASGILSLSTERKAGLWSRVAGDGLDLATLVGGLHPANPKKGNVLLALLMVGGITLLDIATAEEVSAEHAPGTGARRTYSDRSGYPKGVAAARGIGAAKKPKTQIAAS